MNRQKLFRHSFKHLLSVLLAAAVLIGCVSCGSTEPEKAETAGYTFTDDLGRAVKVDSYEKTASLLGSYADIWFLAGGIVTAAPDDAWEDLNLPMPEDAVSLGATKSLNLELLLSSEPDFIIASSNSSQHIEWQPTLESAGIPTAYFDVSTFEDYLRVLKICTDITGRPELYEKYGTSLKNNIDEVVSRSEGRPEQNILSLRASAASVRAKGSRKNVLGEMLLALGCRNIADSDESLLENLSIESIMLQNPDKILIVPAGDDLDAVKENVEKLFAENPLWLELDAVKNDQVYYMDKQLYQMKPNARWSEAYEKLEEILYGAE